ncbi:hypothetical protein DPMN_081144 [Dreissena polymorpha]|uniref:Uncharacterized protein n=1 Tax=Dreissena polymorpha TaxID=45954 RepID=A0A9D3Y835_DREPO|nr:hypothetical protein DPMN_081144 [Dreissena polymorpha]
MLSDNSAPNVEQQIETKCGVANQHRMQSNRSNVESLISKECGVINQQRMWKCGEFGEKTRRMLKNTSALNVEQQIGTDLTNRHRMWSNKAAPNNVEQKKPHRMWSKKSAKNAELKSDTESTECGVTNRHQPSSKTWASNVDRHRMWSNKSAQNVKYKSAPNEVLPIDTQLEVTNQQRCGVTNRHVMHHTANKRFKPTSFCVERSAIHELERCALVINNRMNENKLKMNASKTEFIVFGIVVLYFAEK